MNLTANKKTLALSGVLLGAIAAVLAYMGNPKNMAMCIACFIRDTAGAMKLHQAAVVQYVRPEIIGIICGAFLIAVVTKEYRSTAGSSPAFVFMFIEALADGAVAAGMPRAQAYEFAAAAVAGSAQLVLETGRHPGDLKDMVCSPGGTTIEGVRALEEGAFRASVMNAISACVEKAKAL